MSADTEPLSAIAEHLRDATKMVCDTPEPLAAVIADMRGRILGEDRIKYTLPADEALAFADRIEAAAKRLVREERTEAIDEALAHAEEVREANCRNCTRSPGSAAALREALERLDEHLHEDDYDGHLFFNLFDYDPKEEIRTALAAPARNCDRFATAEEARRAFESAHSHGIVHNLYAAAFAWLFDKAEGGAK